jgi:peptide/nickel transport system substrate-binding protein
MNTLFGKRLGIGGIAFALALSTCIVGLGTSAGASSSGSGGSNTTLLQTKAATKDLSSLTWWIWYRPIASLDPVKYADYPEQLIIPNMCESLVTEAPGQKIVANLATSWTQPNSTTVIFNIRRGVKFWDGTTMTSADVAYSLKRNFVTANASIYAYEPSFQNIKSITATGPYTVKVTLKTPNVTFIPEMASLGGAVVEKAFAQKAGSNFGTPQGKVMCTGPYELQSWNGSTSLVVVKNKNYWNKTLEPKTSKVTFVWPQDPGQVASAFEAGDFAGGFDILPSDIVSLQKATSGALYVGPQSQAVISEILCVIGTKGAIANKDVRQALSLSINRTELISAVDYGIGAPAYTYADPGYFTYQTSAFQAAYAKIAQEYSNSAKAVTEAKKLVKEAGAVAKEPIVLAVQGGNPDAANEAEVVEQSADAVGLNFKLKVVTDAQYGALFSDAAARKGFDLIESSNYDGDPDALALYDDIALPGAISNFNAYDNPAVVKLLGQANGTANTATRAPLVIKAQKLIMQDMPWIPLTFVPGTAFVRKGICGVTLDFSQMYGPWAASVGGC